MKELKEVEVDVTVPKLNVTYKTNVDGKLVNMKRLFAQDEADLSGVNNRRRELSVSKVVHEVSFVMDEQGDEEVSDVSGDRVDTSAGYREFVANRPFFIFLFHQPSNAIVFSGLINNPQLITPSKKS